MDLETGKQQFITFVKKYQYVLLVVLLGVILMLIPQSPGASQPVALTEEAAEPDLQMQLAAILGQISGVGRVEVLLTEAAGADTVYQVDTRQNQANADTVIITDRNREETGLVKRILPPVYRGAVVVCQGADSAGVRLNVMDAVKSVTGLSSDCITVLKMK